MVGPNPIGDVQNIVVTENPNKPKRSRKPLLVMIIFIFLVTVITVAVLYLKSKSPKKEFQEDVHIRDVVPDLYNGKPIELKEQYLYRARLAEYSDDSITLAVFLPVGAETSEIKLHEKTVFNCIPRYWMAPDGTQVDNLNMYVTTKNNEDIKDIPNPPDAKDFEWFKSTAERGEAVEIRYVKADDGDIIPRIIYIYENSCPS